MSDITQGLIIGVGAGVGAGIILSFYAELRKKISRHEQIKFVRSHLIEGFAKCGNVPDPLPADDGEAPPPTDLFRFVVLEGVLRELQAIADHRTGSLKDAQLSDLHRALSDAKNMHAWLSEQQRVPEGLNMYRSLYEGFAKLTWLRLPNAPPWT